MAMRYNLRLSLRFWGLNHSDRGVSMATNPAAILAKWKRNAGNAVADMQAGVRAVTVSPTAKAAAAIPKFLAGVQDAVSSGRMANALNAVSLPEWQAAMLDKGARNYATGVGAISPAAQRRMADQQAYADQVSQQIQAMPNSTEAEAEARAIAAMRLMREYGKRGS